MIIFTFFVALTILITINSPTNELRVDNVRVETIEKDPETGMHTIQINATILKSERTDKPQNVTIELKGDKELRRDISLKSDKKETVELVLDNVPEGSYKLVIADFKKDIQIGERIVLSEYMEKSEELRELEFKDNIPFKTISQPELREYMENNITKEYPEGMEKPKLTLAAFGLFPQDRDFKSTLLDLYTERPLGFYDPEKKEFYIVERESEQNFEENPPESVIIHELTHALQDQHFDLGSLPTNRNPNQDRALSVEALIEGGAMLVELSNLSGEGNLDKIFREDLESKFRERLNSITKNERENDMPLILEKTLTFPYYAGSIFVNAIKKENWKSVNRAYSDPPLSTEQVLHPEKYYEEQDNPTELNVPKLSEILGEDWNLLENNTMGEYSIGVLFLEFLGSESDIERNVEAREGWDGDFYKTYHKENDNSLGLTWFTTWDTQEDAAEFKKRYLKILKEKYSDLSELHENKTASTLVSESEYIIVEKRQKDVLILEGFSKKETQTIKRKIWSETEKDEIKKLE